MRISQLQQILEIISCGSINKAAQKLYISQSGLCATLNAVEKKLGQQILRRSYNGITLTPFGLEFVKSARQIVEIYDQLLVKSLPNEHSRLCISSEFLLYASSAFTMLCNELGDNTEYRFAEKTNDVVLQDVLGEVSDLGIIVTPTAVRERVFSVFEQIGLEGSVLCINECSCLVGPHSPLYHLEQDAVPLEHLALYPRLRYERRPWPVDKDVFRIQDDYSPAAAGSPSTMPAVSRTSYPAPTVSSLVSITAQPIKRSDTTTTSAPLGCPMPTFPGIPSGYGERAVPFRR